MVEPRRFGPFMVVGQIATTAHSRVWEATDSDGQHVAVKELKAHRIDAEPYRRFRDEVAFHTAGPHPGVLPVLDAHVPATASREDPAWLAMPIAETVAMALGTGPTLDEVVDAVRAYAVTLARLAETGVHHRDLKPDNLFRHEAQWVVGDFGLVTWPGKQALTEPGQKLGPAHFVAPEMVQNPASADPGPADAWSLAKVLWVLASGQRGRTTRRPGNSVSAIKRRCFATTPAIREPADLKGSWSRRHASRRPRDRGCGRSRPNSKPG